MKEQHQTKDYDLGICGVMWTRIHMVLGGLYLSYLATRERIDKFRDISWFDPKLNRFDNKLRMKTVGGSRAQYLIFLKTSAILTLAKAIEDCLFLAKKETGWTLRFWRDADRFEHGIDAKEVRSLANILKHNYSIIDALESTSAEFLIQNCGYDEGTSLETLMFEDKGVFDIPKTITSIYCFLLSVTEKVTGIRHAVLDKAPHERAALVRRLLVPELLEL